MPEHEPHPVAPSGAAEAVPGDVILLVDDNRDDADLVRRAFFQVPVENPVRHLRNAEQALAYLSGIGEYGDRRRHPLPIFILLDINMPGMNGLEFLRWLRSQSVLRRIPVVMLTVNEAQSTINSAYDAGANSYLLKPGSPEAVRKVLEQIRQYWQTFNIKPGLVIGNNAKAR